jgi:hypothetical protein
MSFFARFMGICGGLVAGVALQTAMAGTITFNGPQDGNGLTCDPVVNNHCIIGLRQEFQMFSAAITSPNVPNGIWDLTLQTNYPAALPGPGNQVIPNVAYGQAFFAMCDFMNQWNGNDYGIVLHAHDGYTPGNLYQVSGFQTSGAVMGAQGETSPRPSLPSLINAGGNQIGTGILSASANAGADGLTQALYKVEVSFTAPANFLSSGPFTIYACSYVCDNGFITGTGEPLIPGNDVSTPEPATWSLVGLGIGVLGWKARRRKAQQDRPAVV